MEWTKYTTKEALKDNDELMILDTDGKANKRTLMDKIWDYVVDKMTTAVIAKLGTTNKTLIGAVNELNSKSFAEHNVEVSVSNCTVTIKIPELGGYDICTLFIIAQVGNDCYLSVQINHATSYSSAVVSLQGTNIIASSYTWNGGTKVFSIQMNKDYKDIRVSKCYAIK